MKTFLSVILTICCLAGAAYMAPPDGVRFEFKQRKVVLTARMQGGDAVFFPRGRYDDAKLDTLSNWFNPASDYIEIVRQDDPIHPALGIAIGFEFDEDNGDYPYTPAHAVLQLKDFGWGGMEFSVLDTMNYTGVSNDISDDLFIEVDGFQNDTVWGRFSGVLVSGAGKMASIDEGTFRVLVYRKQ